MWARSLSVPLRRAKFGFQAGAAAAADRAQFQAARNAHDDLLPLLRLCDEFQQQVNDVDELQRARDAKAIGANARGSEIGIDAAVSAASFRSFADLLRLHRVSAGLSQEDLAELAQVSVKAISALERGTRRAPYRKTVTLLAQALRLETTERSEFEATAARARVRTGAHNPPRDNRDTFPSQVTSLIGRDGDLNELSRLLARHRIVTLTGSGGVGKTRLSIACAGRERSRYPNGAWFIDLAPLEDGQSVVKKVASTLGMVLDEEDPVASLVAMLRSRKLLLVMDNCEHLIENVASVIGAVLRGCPEVKVLATSRQRLSLMGEVAYRLASLAVPPADRDLTVAESHRYSAVQLFIERAELADHRFVLDAQQAPLVAEICRKLDGIPLAIEICAAQIRALGVSRLRHALDDRLALLSSGFSDVPDRQQTLMATIDWSYDLLDERERAVFRRLSIFAGSCSTEAAQAVCSGDAVTSGFVLKALSSLVDKSLLSAEFISNAPRYSLLESSREFGCRKMKEHGESGTVAMLHAQWAASFADAMLRSSLITSREIWNAQVSLDFDNIYSALGRMLEPQKDLSVAGRILGGLRSYWSVLGRRAESFRVANLILSRLDDDRYPEIAASLNLAKSFYLFGLDRLRLVKRATQLYTRSRNALELSVCYKQLAHSYTELGRLQSALQALGWASTYMALSGIEHSQRTLLMCELRADILQRQGLLDEARAHYQRGVELARRYGDVVIEQSCLASLGELQFFSGQVHEALSTFKFLSMTNHEAFRMHIYQHLAACHIRLGNLPAATESARVPLAARDALPLTKLIAIERLAHIAALKAEPIRASRLTGFVNDEFDRSQFLRDSFEARCSEALLSTLREQLSTESFEMHAREGASFTFEHAVEEALGGRV